MKVLGLIPARGGSKSIPHKNITPLHGKPLIAWTIEAARASQLDRLVLTSDDAEIIRVVREIGGVDVPFMRPAEFATDTAPAIDVVLHAITWLADHEGYRPDAVMLLQPTSPLRRTEHINAALDLFVQQDAETLVSVVKAPHNMTPESLMRLGSEGWLEPVIPLDERKNLRQIKPVYYARNGPAILMTRTDVLLNKRALYGSKIAAYEMSREDSIDVDDPFDLQLCAWILAARLSAATG